MTRTHVIREHLSLPPCGGGLGRGVSTTSKVLHHPLPRPSPIKREGGSESSDRVSSMRLSRAVRGKRLRSYVSRAEIGVDPGLRRDDVCIEQCARFTPTVIPAQAGIYASFTKRSAACGQASRGICVEGL